ncbi:MAG: membrane protein insertase YidC [Spirochaetaceae bacterium]|jgi:YidC/Oxa1 family membrane protein insertase|nr:membrane protein insertase YidC [Spirochaetaceae bacterium]
MEKRTILAVVLSVIVISVFYLIQAVFFMPTPVTTSQTAAQTAPITSEPLSTSGEFLSGAETEPANSTVVNEVLTDAPVSEQLISVNTGLLMVTLTNAGGDIVSYKLTKHFDQDEPVEMIFAGTAEAHAFSLAFGGLNAVPLTSFFYMRRLSEYSVEYYRDFMVNDKTIRLTKRYNFKPDEYLFELIINLTGDNSLSAIDFSGAAYTLGFGPQIGPQFDKLDQRSEYRTYFTYTNGKRKQEKVTESGPTIITNRPSWAAIAGKYFTLIAIPYPAQYDIAFSSAAEPGLSGASRLYITRPAIASSRTEDTYRFYLGPKNQETLTIYNNGANSFGLRDMELLKVANTSGILAPLETGLKWLLMVFYKIIPNYGVAIILLTLLVKVLFFPLTKRSSEATLRMQALSPKIKEIQDKYKGNSQKMNMEMAELYKKEGYNPLSGCLPMLLQIPIFIAMYNLFNNHFDLRGALFIPGWIPDLSLPESVWNFAPLQIPLLGWSDIRALPFIYVASQLLYGKITQTPDQQGNAQTKIMLFILPLVFFFALYDVPSGLLVYWIMSNALSLVQQIIINKYVAQRKAAMPVTFTKPVIAPPKKKRK